MNLPVRGIVAGVLALGVSAVAQEPGQKEHARARLVSESRVLIPGTTAWLGLHFEIEDHWHLYWNGVNDSGFAPAFKPEFPAEFKAGEVLWPAPRRLIQPGDILDHIYEKKVTLLIPVQVPRDAAPGSSVEFKGSVEWLVCHEVCLPGNADLSLKVGVGKPGEAAEPGPDAPLFAAARERIPKPIPKTNAPIRMEATESKVVIETTGAAEVAFYPGLGNVPMGALVKEGQKKGDKLVISYKREDGKVPKLRGVIEVKPPKGGSPTLWVVEAELEANKPILSPSNSDSRIRGD